MQSYLKVKLHTLASENKYIKDQQRIWKERAKRARARERDLAFPAEVKSMAGQHVRFAEANYFGLRAHRCGEHGVQKEARDTNLAYGFLRGRDYWKMEGFAYSKPNWSNIERMVKRYGATPDEAADTRDLMQRFSGWKDAAVAHWQEAQDSHRLAHDAKNTRPHKPGTRRPAGVAL